jgi:hypothetical protein
MAPKFATRGRPRMNAGEVSPGQRLTGSACNAPLAVIEGQQRRRASIGEQNHCWQTQLAATVPGAPGKRRSDNEYRVSCPRE